MWETFQLGFTFPYIPGVWVSKAHLIVTYWSLRVSAYVEDLLQDSTLFSLLLDWNVFLSGFVGSSSHRDSSAFILSPGVFFMDYMES